MSNTTVMCEVCNGSGLVDRQPGQSALLGGKELCAKCGGAGKIPYLPPRTLKEPGFVADQIGVP